MTRTLLLAVAAIALFFAGSVAIVYGLTGSDGPATPTAPTFAAAAPLAQAAAPVAPPTSVAPQAPAPGAPPPGQELLSPDAPALGPKPPPAWLSAPTAKLGPQPDRTPLGPLRPYVAAGLARLRTNVAECADEAPAGPSDAAARKGAGATLTLHLEALDNQLRIADATLADAGAAAADDWRVACARRKLRGKLIPAPTKPGTSLEVPFVLSI